MYDGVITGDKGLLAAFFMAGLLLSTWLWHGLAPTRLRRGPSAGTTLVNAAVVAGRLNEVVQQPVVVEL